MLDNPMKDLQGSTLDQELVSRKLTGTYATFSVDVPWEYFDDLVDTIQSDLDNVSLDIDRNLIASNPKVLKLFEGAIKACFDDAGWENDLSDHYYHAATSIYGKEIQAAQAERERERQAAIKAAQAEMEAKATVIHVPVKMAKKARAILLAAGILKA